jgi:hypothetical protein
METRPNGRARALAILGIVAVVAIPTVVVVATWGDLPWSPADLRPDRPVPMRTIRSDSEDALRVKSADATPRAQPAGERSDRLARATERAAAADGTPVARGREPRADRAAMLDDATPRAQPAGERSDRLARATERAAAADGTPVARGREPRADRAAMHDDATPDARSDRPRRRDRPADTVVSSRSEVTEASPQAQGRGESARDQSTPNA